MREKLNESKAAQVGLIVVLAAVAAYMLLGKGGGESESSEAQAATPTTESTEVVATTSAGMGQLPTSVPAQKWPPHAFRVAYEADQTVALLVVHDGGIDDEYTKEALGEVAPLESVAAFVVPAKQISRYASVTVGLDINQLPALVILRPRNLSHGAPQGTVLYGYQTPESILVAVRGATYDGPEKSTYHPN